MGERVLVTGGSGRLGTQLVQDLVTNGHEVVAVDRVAPREPLPAGATYREADLSDIGQIAGAMKGCTAFAHLGAIPSPYRHADEVVFTNNTVATLSGHPNTDWLANCDVALDAKGFVRTGPDLAPTTGLMETSRSGVFAIGDVRCGSIKRVAAAVGEGARVDRALISKAIDASVTPEQIDRAVEDRYYMDLYDDSAN